eukprot:CAMPEP_0197191414 /NCGR_PEP_ID=MMETSP1423-20130617/23355_1 /TAXON_ID=476441 /ORGANISM="Pseudo-nitzschia heimii, Strain UNC1101" /LENGTH=248 /DNA_ID=CAMNT_0042644041 /DNA_START=142 /DNA_END=885 /DNA_ORIENTATION=+
MTAFKRKNEDSGDDILNQESKMVIVRDQGETEENVNQDSPTVLLTTIERMKKLSEQWAMEQPVGFATNEVIDKAETHDDIVQSINSIRNGCEADEGMERSLFQKADEIKNHLSSKIKLANDLRKNETNILQELSAELSNFHNQRQKLLREIDELDDRQLRSQEKIAKYQAEASQELDIILDVEAEQKLKVPRLKMTISLYASTTGIKWDFADPNLLSGQVEIPSQNSFKLFQIDPRDYSSVEMADMLW